MHRFREDQSAKAPVVTLRYNKARLIKNGLGGGGGNETNLRISGSYSAGSSVAR